MDIHRFWMVGIAFVAMSMFGLVHAGFSFQDEHPVYTADGTAGTATLELTEDKVKFTIEKQGADTGSKMEMTLGGCEFDVSYVENGGGKVLFGGELKNENKLHLFSDGDSVSLESSVTASATSSAVSYGGKTGKCEGAIKFEKVGGKFKTDVSFDYPKTDHPPLKFTFVSFRFFSFTSSVPDECREIHCERRGIQDDRCTNCGCCWNDPGQCSMWNLRKKQRMKALELNRKPENEEP
ncbi:hypothetical protein M3Y98_00786800 [Aphelenchoides besseyi]|nr:hypothetical protein M3Y98_00786800 [Aphelenchoides besseyi]